MIPQFRLQVRNCWARSTVTIGKQLANILQNYLANIFRNQFVNILANLLRFAKIFQDINQDSSGVAGDTNRRCYLTCTCPVILRKLQICRITLFIINKFIKITGILPFHMSLAGYSSSLALPPFLDFLSIIHQPLAILYNPSSILRQPLAIVYCKRP